MAHEVHTTEAIVLASANVQDSDRLFWLLTEDFGLLFASAKSVREEVSKLRYSLQDLAHVRVSLVKGRGFWRITGAYIDGEENQQLTTTKLKTFGRIVTLVRRLLLKEERNDALFSVVARARIALSSGIHAEDIIETITVARILYHFGYFPYIDGKDEFIKSDSLSEDVIYGIEKRKKEILNYINQGLVESHV